MGIPMLCGVVDSGKMFRGQLCVVDGNRGVAVLSPSDATLALFKAQSTEVQRPPVNGSKPTGSFMTSDAVRITIRANIDHADIYSRVNESGACGIGLFRSESLIHRVGNIPTEDEQVDVYTKVAESAEGEQIGIRTFDLDRSWFDPSVTEYNPALGLRALRFSLTDPKHFCVQVRAILRAGFGRRIDIILPMISGVDDVVRAKAIIGEERSRLTNEGFEVGEPQIGAMIETPSSVLTAFEIAQQVNFLCLGTNDLVQYLLVVDRDNDAVADWYQTLHPAVLRAITEVISAADRANIPLIVCGEMAGSPFYAPVLLGLGAREFSMNLKSIPAIRQLLSSISVQEAQDLVADISSLDTADKIENYLRSHYMANWKSYFPADFIFDHPF